MNSRLRKILADSHIGAVSIAVLLFWSLDYAVLAVSPLVYRAAVFLFTTIAIFDIPYFSFDSAERLEFINLFLYFYVAIVSFAAAWLLAKWIYSEGPFRSLISCRTRLMRNHA